ncbi:MAG: ATP-binding protein, partial [Nitrosopumilales archaeon]
VCDRCRIEQVLANLIANSLDFVPKQTGRIHLSLISDNGHAKIIVKDNGIGIIKESIGKIFVKFYQVDTTSTRQHGGTGLGLVVCKGIVENHGGKIWAESDGEGKGTTIHIKLPTAGKQ